MPYVKVPRYKCVLCSQRTIKKKGIDYCIDCRFHRTGAVRKDMIHRDTAPKRKCACGCGAYVYFDARWAREHRLYPAAWNKGLTKKTDKRVAAYAKKRIGKTLSACSKRLISKANKGKRTGKDNPFYGKTHPLWLRKQIGLKIKGRVSTFLGRHHTKASKKKLSISTSSRLQQGWFPYRKCLYEHDRRNVAIWMRSSWEVAFAEYLDDLELTWSYEPKTFELSIGGYTPDFYVKDWHSYVEIKGAEWIESMRKLRYFPRETGLKLLIYKQKDLVSLGVLI